MSDYPSTCPHCNANLEGDDIFQAFVSIYPIQPEKAMKAALEYGWTPEKPIKFSRILSVYDRDKDITTQSLCPDCKKIVD